LVDINQKRFDEVLRKAQKGVPSKTPMEIIKNIKLSVENDILYVEVTDGQIYVRQKIEAADDTLEVIEEGSICVPARRFIDTIRLMTSETITLQLKGKILYVKGQKQGKSSKSQMKINGEDSSEFPNPPKDKESKFAEIQGAELKQMIQKTVFATSKHETRPVLTGVLFSKKDSFMNVVATDAHRMSQYRVDLDDFRDEDNVEYDSVIPNGALNKISSYIKEEDKVEVYQSQKNNNLSIYSKDVFVQTRLLTGEYPNTDRLIPKETKINIRINRAEFIDSLKRTSIMSDPDQHKVVTFNLGDDDNTITLSSNDTSGESTEVLEAIEREGESIKLSFSIDYMLDALNQLEEDEVQLNFNSAVQPIVIWENNHTQLVLPVRTY